MKITKNQRINQIADQLARQQGVISKLTIMVKEQNEAILMLEKLTDEKLRDQPEPQLKQLDQSVFDGAHEMWRFASVDADGAGFRFAERPELTDCFWRNVNCSRFDRLSQSGTYNASNWQNSLIERDTAKELVEVGLSSELTGSELCRAMLARGDKYVMCFVHEFGDDRAIEDEASVAINFFNEYGFQTDSNQYNNAVPINNQGEPLTASEVGL